MSDVARIITGLLIDPAVQKVKRVAFNQAKLIPQLNKLVLDPCTLDLVGTGKPHAKIERLSGGFVCVNEIGSIEIERASCVYYFTHKPSNASFCFKSVILRQTADGAYASVAPGEDQETFLASISYGFVEEPYSYFNDEDPGQEEWDDINSVF